MHEIFAFDFMRNALMAALLSSIACGIIGSYIVVKRIGFISGGIAHTAFGGIGLGYYLGINPLLGVVPFTLFAALAVGLLGRKARVAEDTAIGTLWAMGMASGILFIGLRPGYAPDLFSYLFGNILTVPTADLWMIALLDSVIVAVVWLFNKEFLAISFDEEYAQVSGVRVTLFYLLLLCLIALTVVMMVRVVGIVLVIALLTIPAALARFFSRSVTGMMVRAMLFAMLFSVVGLWLSYQLDIASGATIILVAGTTFFAVQAWRIVASMVSSSSR